MQQDAAASRPHPRVCPWCISTVTFAARRCVFCGMSLAEELQTAQTVPQQVAAMEAPGTSHARPRILALMAGLALALVLYLLIMHGMRLPR